MLSAFTGFHVVLSLVGIASGVVVLYGFLTSRLFGRAVSVFLITTIATSLTGFLFPFREFLPSHAVGILSLIVLGLAVRARRNFLRDGSWRRTFVVTSVIALYLNVFVLIVQSFLKVPALNALAPTQSEPPFQMTQFTVLLIFLGLGFRAAKRGAASRPAAARAAVTGRD
jgi:hypothetical protein